MPNFETLTTTKAGKDVDQQEFSFLAGEVNEKCYSHSGRLIIFFNKIKWPQYMIQQFHSLIFISQNWCTGKTQRDRVEREVGGGIGMGNTCKSMADSCQSMTKPLQYCKVISLQLIKISEKN